MTTPILDNKVWVNGDAPILSDEQFIALWGKHMVPKIGDTKLYDKDWAGEYILIEHLPGPFPLVDYFVFVAFNVPERNGVPLFLINHLPVKEGCPANIRDELGGLCMMMKTAEDYPDFIMRRINAVGVREWLLAHEQEIALESEKEIPLDPLDCLAGVFYQYVGRRPQLSNKVAVATNQRRP